MKRFSLTPLLLIIFLISGCNISPTKPDLDDESKNIPWQMISGKIAYSRTEMAPGLIGYLFIIDGNSKRVNLVKKAERRQFTNLSWKNDGSTLTFSDFDDSRMLWQLLNIFPDGSNLVNIYPGDAHCNYPAWSTNGKLAYFYNGVEHLGEIRIDGSTFFYNGKESCNQSRPAWSPDCKSLVISIADEKAQVSFIKVNLLDKSVTPLLKAEGNGGEEIFDAPIYSPNGKQIAFHKYGSSIGDNEEIWIMNSDGSNPEKLTSGNIDYSPAWSPDGQYIAFCRTLDVRMGITKIFIIGLNDRSIIQVTENVARYLTWIQ
ncbi:MAG TPA: hypothetical protein VMZ49_12520 [Patescibacteria group bacterium]|nr:hypothetical protein [Patescibacteria group bacterium]